MKYVILLALLAVVAARPEEDHYNDKYDNFNVDEIIESKRLLKSYALCFLGEGKCTPEGQDFKKWIPEGTTSSCKKCTDKQKSLVAKFIKAMMDTLPEEWSRLNDSVDPEKKHQEELKSFLDKYTS